MRKLSYWSYGPSANQDHTLTSHCVVKARNLLLRNTQLVIQIIIGIWIQYKYILTNESHLHKHISLIVVFTVFVEGQAWFRAETIATYWASHFETQMFQSYVRLKFTLFLKLPWTHLAPDVVTRVYSYMSFYPILMVSCIMTMGTFKHLFIRAIVANTVDWYICYQVTSGLLKLISHPWSLSWQVVVPSAWLWFTWSQKQKS